MSLIRKIHANVLAGKKLTKLLNTEKIIRLIESDFSGALTLLNEYGYDVNAKCGVEEVEQFLAFETAKLIKFVQDECVDEQLKNCLLAPFYYCDIKLLYKSKYTKIQFKSDTFKDLENALMSCNYSALPIYAADALNELDTSLKTRTLNSRDIDIILIKAMYADCLFNAKKSGDKKLIKYVVAGIDLSNIYSAVRLKRLCFDNSVFDSEYIIGGEISKEMLDDIFVLNEGELINKFSGVEYFELIKKILDPKAKCVNLQIARTLRNIFAVSSHNVMSVCPFANCFFAQLSQIELLRFILVCLGMGQNDELKSCVKELELI